MKRVRPVTVLLLVLIVVLGYSLVVRQRRAARLRAALAAYKGRATGDLADILGRSVGMYWPEDTPLAEAIEQIKVSTPAFWGFPKGLPILVDPDGLREAGRSLGSPVGAAPPDELDGEEVPLRQKLRLILEPLGLAAEVRDGAIVITSRARVGEPSVAEGEPDE